MSQNLQVKLDYSAILNIPLDSYCKDFTFIVNNKEFKTSRLISEILSPRIVKMHLNDPTIDTFIINTHERGDFSKILNLVNFKQTEITSSEINFITEVLEILSNEFIQVSFPENKELTNENVFQNLQKHAKNSIFYKQRYEEEIKFIASHFNELVTNHEKELFRMELDTFQKIIKHDDFQIEDEDQLLTFVNKLFKMDNKYSILYENVYFTNASSSAIKEFIEIYEIQYINQQIWQRICDRLEKESKKHTAIENRYKKQIEKGEKFLSSSPFDGIINYLRTKSNDKIENYIEITASSCGYSDSNYQPKTVLLKENKA